MSDITTAPTADPIAEAIAKQVYDAKFNNTISVKASAIEAITKALQDEVDNDRLEREDAHRIFSAFATYLGTTVDNPFQTKYRVSVTNGHYGGRIFTVEVEADSEEEAQEEVEQNLSVTNIVLNVSLEYNGSYDSEDGEFEYEDNYAVDIDDLDLQFEVSPVD